MRRYPGMESSCQAPFLWCCSEPSRIEALLGRAGERCHLFSKRWALKAEPASLPSLVLQRLRLLQAPALL